MNELGCEGQVYGPCAQMSNPWALHLGLCFAERDDLGYNAPAGPLEAVIQRRAAVLSVDKGVSV